MPLESRRFTFTEPRSLNHDEVRLLSAQQQMNDFKSRKLEIDVRKNWDRFYKRNEDRFFKDRHWTKNEINEILPDVDLNACLVFLEAGCGVGNMLFPLTEYFPQWQFYGFDFSANAIMQLKKRAEVQNVNVHTSVFDLSDSTCQLAFPEANLATLVFVLSAIHPDKHHQTIANLKRNVRMGGYVFFRDYGVLDYAMIRFGPRSKISDRFYARQDGTRSYYFYSEEVRRLFEDNGFRCEMVAYLNKQTINYEKKLTVERVFVQGRFARVA